nr:unnamed protein product [Digitaria exilis]
MAGVGDEDDLAALLEQASMYSTSDRDLALQLRLAEAVKASPESSDAAYAPESSDAAYALAHRARPPRRAGPPRARRRIRPRRRARRALRAGARRHPEDRWAHDGDRFERPLGSSDDDPSLRPLFSVSAKGLASKDVVGPRDRDPGVAVLAAAVCGPEGEVVIRVQKPVDGFVGGREVLEGMALMEGLHAALGLGIHRVEVLIDYRPLYNYIWSIRFS